jgi:glycosyltransferase involved in cell wall biosynthesis
MMRRAARVIAVAEAVRTDTVENLRVREGQVVTIPNAVDIERVTARVGREETRRNLGIEPATPLVAWIGSLTWEKDPIEAVRVHARVTGRIPDGVLVLVGDGHLREPAQEEARRLGIGERVRFLGVRDDVADVLGAADLLLFTSRPDGMEGMPAALIEASMLGVPAVAFDVAGVAEVVRDGQTGRVVRWGDGAELAESARALLDDEELRLRLGGAARAFATERFDIRRIAPDYLQVYREVAS